jgi:hypothetical protein
MLDTLQDNTTGGTETPLGTSLQATTRLLGVQAHSLNTVIVPCPYHCYFIRRAVRKAAVWQLYVPLYSAA